MSTSNSDKSTTIERSFCWIETLYSYFGLKLDVSSYNVAIDI